MPDYVTPVTWKFNGSNSADDSSFVVDGHSVSAPYLVLFDRRVPVANGQGPTIPQYRIRFLHGELDGDGVPLATKNLVEIVVRWPVDGTPATAKSLIALAASVIADTDLQSDIIDEMLLPR